MAEYVKGGGDDGDTVKYIRHACGLPVECAAAAPLIQSMDFEGEATSIDKEDLAFKKESLVI